MDIDITPSKFAMNILILSDIHGNLTALESALAQAADSTIDACILLGDLIDYGMFSNEVVRRIKALPYPCLCSIWGNHEYAICKEDYQRFASQRGQLCAQYTRSVLDEDSWRYLREDMMPAGKQEFMLEGKLCLAVHGSAEDPYWGKIKPGAAVKDYYRYDYVFSGHSHIPHFFEVLSKAYAPEHRNQKKTVFINPGSVGQPRNLCPMAQFMILDTKSGQVLALRTPYDIAKEQAAYAGQVDNFYNERLATGI